MVEDKKNDDKNNNHRNSVYGYQNISDNSKIQTNKYIYVDGRIVRIDNYRNNIENK